MTDLTLLPIEVQRLRHLAMLELKAADQAEARARTIALSPACPEACLRVLLFQLAWERRRVAQATLLDALLQIAAAVDQKPAMRARFDTSARSILAQLDAIAAASAPVRTAVVESEAAILH